MICLVIPILSLLLFIQSLYSLSKLQIFSFTCIIAQEESGASHAHAWRGAWQQCMYSAKNLRSLKRCMHIHVHVCIAGGICGASGKCTVESPIKDTPNEKALKCKPLLVSNGIPSGHACAARQDHVQAMCAESAASQFSLR